MNVANRVFNLVKNINGTVLKELDLDYPLYILLSTWKLSQNTKCRYKIYFELKKSIMDFDILGEYKN